MLNPVRLLSPLLLIIAALAPARAADAVEDFYRGKQLRLVIGYSVGGGYDIYGRVAAEFLGRFIPGNPTIIPQNMPGAGSLTAARFMYAIASKDGTTLAVLSQTLPLDTLLQGEKAGFDITQMPYIGRLTGNVDFGMGMGPGKASFKTFEDARQKQLVVAGTAGASPGNVFPTALTKLAGAKFRMLTGYPGSAEMGLALERGEVDLVGAMGLASTMVKNPEWIVGKERTIIYQAAVRRHALLPDVPTIEELGTTPENQAILRALASSSEIGRSILTTPGVPKERLDALRKALGSMLADKEFRARMEERRIIVEPANGEDLDAIVREIATLPKSRVEQIRELLKE